MLEKDFLSWDLVDGWDIDIDVKDMFSNLNHTSYHVKSKVQEWVDFAEGLGDDWQANGIELGKEIVEGMLEGAINNLICDAMKGDKEALNLLEKLVYHSKKTNQKLNELTDLDAKNIIDELNTIGPNNAFLDTLKRGTEILYLSNNIFVAPALAIIYVILIVIAIIIIIVFIVWLIFHLSTLYRQ